MLERFLFYRFNVVTIRLICAQVEPDYLKGTNYLGTYFCVFWPFSRN